MSGKGRSFLAKILFSAAVAQFLALALVAPPMADIGSNSLRVDSTDFDVLLTWNAGTGPYAIYRSTSPAGVAVPAQGDNGKPVERGHHQRLAVVHYAVTDPDRSLQRKPGHHAGQERLQ